MKIAVIPARGGSKRIPRKNIKCFHGKPMIAWSIIAALESNLFDQVIVSTDDEEISSISNEYGASTPFIRPKDISDDFSTTADVMSHAVKWMYESDYLLDSICCIYPAAPFVQINDLKDSWKIFKSNSCEYVFTATAFQSSIFRGFKVIENNSVEMIYPELFESRSQDLPAVYHDAAQFYWGKPLAWLEGKRIFAKHSQAFLLPNYRVQDIDTEDDWRRAELIASSLLD
jgi:N-acylneuraminate cytidylyltransferase